MTHQPDHLDHDSIARDFAKAVNMTPTELEHWLETKESKQVGYTPSGETEAVGHQSGRHTVTILRTKKADLTDEDYRHMRKVTGYVHRHLAQGGPRHDEAHSNWRYSLMNWGHDPAKT